MLMDFNEYALAPDGAFMCSRPQALLLALQHPEETAAIRYLREQIETVFAAFVTGQFNETAIGTLRGEQEDPNKIRVRVFESWLDGKLTLKNPRDTSWIPERPPTSKAELARWKLTGRDVEAARAVWSILDLLTKRPITEAR